MLAGNTITQQLARMGSGAVAVLEGHLAVDHDPTIAFRLLYSPPIVRRDVAHDLPGLDVELVEIVNEDVRGEPFTQATAVLESCCICREVAQVIVSLLKGDEAFIAGQ